MGTSGTDVLIVGAGPTGLTLACELRRRNIDCRVVDRAAEFHHRSRGKGLQPRSLEVLDDLGIVDRALQLGRRDTHLRLYVGGRLTVDVRLPARPPRPGIPYPDLLIIPQWATEQVLRDRLENLGGTVELGRELSGLDQDEDAVTAALTSGSGSASPDRVRARYVVACDGGHSAVRDLVGLAMDDTSKAQHFVLGDVRIDGLDPATSYAWFDGADYLAADPLSGTGTWQVQANPPVGADGGVERASLELFQRLFDQRGLPGARLSDATWLSDFSPRVGMVDRYRRGRVFVAGDAAHVHSPAGGQGMNTGIQDAYNLGWKLALVLQDRASDRLLDTYQEERLPAARSVLTGSDTGHSAVFSPTPVMRVVRERVLAPLLQLAAVQRAILDRAAELGVGYRACTLAREDEAPFLPTAASGGGPLADLVGRVRFARGPRAGDRAPDARGRAADGERPVRLFDHFRGPHWSLLLFPGTTAGRDDRARLAEIARRMDADVGGDVRSCVVLPAGSALGDLADVPVFLDSEGEAHRLYGAGGGGAYLVRPDGCVGHRGRPAEERSLLAYLGEVFDRERARGVGASTVGARRSGL